MVAKEVHVCLFLLRLFSCRVNVNMKYIKLFSNDVRFRLHAASSWGADRENHQSGGLQRSEWAETPRCQSRKRVRFV